MAPETIAELLSFGNDAYVMRYGNYTSMFLVTGEGVILVDPAGQTIPQMPNVTKAAIRSITDQPVKYVIYSNWGSDHVRGGGVFADTAEFVGHENIVPKVIAADDPNTPVPTVTFKDTMTLRLGDKALDLRFADLHDDDDFIVIHYPEGKLLMYVDIVQPRNIAFRTLVGVPERIVKSIDWVHDNLDFETQIYGHAIPKISATKADFIEMKGYYHDLDAAIEAARAKGMADNSEEMQASVKDALAPKYSSWGRWEMLPENIRGMIGWRDGSITSRFGQPPAVRSGQR
jgi:hypothetical protein